MKKNYLKNNTLNEIDIQTVYIHPTYPRDSKIHSNKVFVNIKNGSTGGTHWCCFIRKDNK